MGRQRLAVLGLIVAAVTGFAQSTPQQLEQTVDGTVGIQQQTQKLQDDWDVEKAALLARYRAAKQQVDYLSERERAQGEKAAALDERIDELERRFAESTRLSESIQDTLGVIFQRLQAWVSQDLPFLPREREARLASVKEDLARPDITAAEKLRRLLEALQIEAVYGGTVEVYNDRITVGGEELFVELLRVGRLSLFWRTPDGNRVGQYDPVARRYVLLPGKYNRNIMRAIEMASRLRPVELIALPLGRIRP
jgi:hypothetical protein